MKDRKLITVGNVHITIVVDREAETCETSFYQEDVGTGDLDDPETIASLFANLAAAMQKIQPFVAEVK